MSNTATQVQQAYLAYFGRPADVVGLNYWEGTSLAAMTAGFTGSAEFTSLYAGMTTAQQVDQVYLNVLGRHADVSGLTYWSGQLQSGVSISALVSAIYQTVLAESPTSVDYVTVQNRVAYATQFTGVMSTSTTDILGYAGNAAASAARTALFNAVPSSSTATTTFSTLATDVTSVADAGSTAAATSFTLTTSAVKKSSKTQSVIGTELVNSVSTFISFITLSARTRLNDFSKGFSVECGQIA